MAIQVITHNGLLPSQGGKRIAYVVRGKGRILTAPLLGLASVEPLHPVAKRVPVDHTNAVAMMASDVKRQKANEDYPHCGAKWHKLSLEQAYEMKDRSIRSLQRCYSCDKLSAPALG